MELKEKAMNYANEKALQFIKEAIGQAYMDGYQAGYEDRETNNPAVKETSHNRTYIDLGLPSRTLWTSRFLESEGKTAFLTYDEACKHSGYFPTKAQWEEVLSICKLVKNVDKDGKFYTDVIGPNGNYIRLTGEGIKKQDISCLKNVVKFWLRSKDDSSEGNNRSNYTLSQSGTPTFGKTFSGYRMPILLITRH